LVGHTNGKIDLKRQTAHADTVAGLPVLLADTAFLRRTAEPTRLHTSA